MLKTFFKRIAPAALTRVALQKLLPYLYLLIFSSLFFAGPSNCVLSQTVDPDTKMLLNGRIWWNKYSRAVGNQYFMEGSSRTGSVVFNDQPYSGLDLKYDIANDELIFSSENHPVICMNKEMVDSFMLDYTDRTYVFFNAGNDTSSVLKGYVNLLYKGPSTLYVKYSKKIYPLAVDGRFDLFAEEHQIFLNTVNGIIEIKGKRQLLNILNDKKKELNHFIRENKVKFNIRTPYSIIPVVGYYDKIKSGKQ